MLLSVLQTMDFCQFHGKGGPNDYCTLDMACTALPNDWPGIILSTSRSCSCNCFLYKFGNLYYAVAALLYRE